jgi:hypothetical protein
LQSLSGQAHGEAYPAARRWRKSAGTERPPHKPSKLDIGEFSLCQRTSRT